MKKLTFFIQIILILFFVSTVKAVDPTPSLTNTYCRFYPDGQAGVAGGNVTLSTSCAIYGDVDGVVDGDLTILPNTAITLHKTLVFDRGYKIDIQELGTGPDKQRGIVYINTGGIIKQGEICVKDNDNDGYAETKTLDKDPYGVALVNTITQIDQIFSEGPCSAPYRLRAGMNDLTLVDNDPNTVDITKLSTSDREMLRLGFEISGVKDAQAGVGDIQIIDKNLLVCTASGCPGTTFNPLKGNLYVASKVGIGTTNPTALLSVGSVAVNSTSNNYIFGYGYAKTDTNLRRAGALAQSNETSQPFSLYVGVIGAAADANRAALLQTGVEALNNSGNLLLQPYGGNVGIGKLNPGTILDVNGTVTATTFSGALSGNATTATTLAGGWGIYATNRPRIADIGCSGGWAGSCDVGNSGWIDYADGAGNADTADGLHVATGRNNAANQIVRTDASGYIQAGYINSSNGNENNAASPTQVWGSVNSDGYMRTYQTAYLVAGRATSLGGGGSTIYGGYGTAYSSAVQVREANLGGAQGNAVAAAPRLAFHWSGVVASSIIIEASGRIAIANNPGTAYEQLVASTMSTTSDIREKQNVKTLDNALEKVLQLRGVSFNWKNDNRADIGVIAQEVEKVYPQFVSTNDIGMKSVAYGNIVAPLIEAIKEQQTEIDSLKQQVTDLNQRLIELENKLK